MTGKFFILLSILLGTLVADAALDEDAVNISPQFYSVKFENDEVRVLEYRLKPGESEPMHAHPRGVVYFLSDATVVVSYPDGSISEGSSTQGQVSWREYTRHAVKNTGSTEAHAIAIELKLPAS